MTNGAPDDGVIANSGREFWLAFNRNVQDDWDAALTLFVTAPTDTSGTVEVPGLGFSTPFEVTAGEVTSIGLPPEASLPNTTYEDRKVPLAVRVVAEDEVTVYGLNYIPFTTDAFLALPVDALGTDYRTLSYASNSCTRSASCPRPTTPRSRSPRWCRCPATKRASPYTEIVRHRRGADAAAV